VLLVYSTIAIHSCANAENAAALDQQMQAIIEADVEQHGQLSVWRQLQQPLLAAEGAPAGEESAEAQQTVQFGCAQVRLCGAQSIGRTQLHCLACQHQQFISAVLWQCLICRGLGQTAIITRGLGKLCTLTDTLKSTNILIFGLRCAACMYRPCCCCSTADTLADALRAWPGCAPHGSSAPPVRPARKAG
jgi:hypothetical protein